ncbi:phosphate ABC transporter ATP-binding protein [Pseudalkalibacillus berkeleyi]|uniref:Phosphate ABC transporter ATP-binding protein n=1 Tax=Pseudalkalibacillus berkeleyi TaxID=1069813 RepID=A0ABS9GYQ6_9BACL|nr:phosphate ABC transporter ATP-binding protein [Pseudalkalibacillus berkeleyi]MCF6137897.1 phosphate ABC transporter ATP-binding protein [Pseudalkalibacillus berkeleyi]
MDTKTVLKSERVTSDILSELTFELKDKQITTIIGPSGAGKSSLLLLLNRLKEPSSGTIHFKGQNIMGLPITKLRREIGMVFQSAHLFDGTTEENIEYGPQLHGKWDPSETKQLLDLVELPQSFLTRNVNSLSGGEQQRVAIARTLANKPSLLLLDEATSALDIKTADHIESVLAKLRDEKSMAILMVTHNLKQAKKISDQTFFIQNGRLVEKGPSTQLFHKPQTVELKQFLED